MLVTSSSNSDLDFLYFSCISCGIVPSISVTRVRSEGKDMDKDQTQTSNFCSQLSRSCSSRVTCLSKCSALTSTWRSLRYRSQSMPTHAKANKHETYFSTVSLTFFSALSSSSSRSWTLRVRLSLAARALSPSAPVRLSSLT